MCHLAPLVISTNTYSFTFYFFAGINCLLALFVIFVVPETRNVMLEEMDTLFGGVNHVEKGGARLDDEGGHAMSDQKAQGQHTGAEDIVPAQPVISKLNV